MKYNENLLWTACSPQSVYNRPRDLFLDGFINGLPWRSWWLLNLEIHSLLRCYAWSFLYFVFKKSNYCSAWWHTTLIPALGSRDGWICVRLRLDRATQQDSKIIIVITVMMKMLINCYCYKMWWCRPGIPRVGKCRQKDRESMAGFGDRWDGSGGTNSSLAVLMT